MNAPRVGMVWYGMVWYGMVWYGMVWYGMVCNNEVSKYTYITNCNFGPKGYLVRPRYNYSTIPVRHTGGGCILPIVVKKKSMSSFSRFFPFLGHQKPRANPPKTPKTQDPRPGPVLRSTNGNQSFFEGIFVEKRILFTILSQKG